MQASGQAEVTGPRVVGDEREQRRRQKEEEQRQVRPRRDSLLGADSRFPLAMQRCVASGLGEHHCPRGLSLMVG